MTIGGLIFLQIHLEGQDIYFGKDGISCYGACVHIREEGSDRLITKKYLVFSNHNDQGGMVRSFD